MAKSRTSVEMMVNTRPRIVILGAGFAGAYCAHELQKVLRGRNADVLVIDPNNYFIFYPLLVEAGVGSLEPRHAVVPIRQFLSRSVRFRLANVVGVDPTRQTVTYRMVGEEQNRVAEYDHLVLAMGSVTSMPPIPGLREHGFQIKGLADSIALRDRAIQMLEVANVTADEKTRRAMLHFVVAGSNFTGIEVAGEFHEFLRGGTRHYRNLKPRDCQVTVVERLPRILPALDKDLADYAEKTMRRTGVNFRLGRSVAAVHPDRLVLDNGEEIAAHTLVWCAGIAQNPVAKSLPLPQDERGYIAAERDLRVKGMNNVWAAGDGAATFGPDGKRYPATAQIAMRQGIHLARNLARVLEGRSPRPCEVKDLGAISALGCRTAVASLFGIKLSGFWAWWLWRTVYLMKMPTFSRKVRVALDWTLNMFFRKDYVELGLHQSRKTP